MSKGKTEAEINANAHFVLGSEAEKNMDIDSAINHYVESNHCYWHELGVSDNGDSYYAPAIGKLIDIARKTGNPNAINALGKIFYHGQGVKKNRDISTELFAITKLRKTDIGYRFTPQERKIIFSDLYDKSPDLRIIKSISNYELCNIDDKDEYEMVSSSEIPLEGTALCASAVPFTHKPDIRGNTHQNNASPNWASSLSRNSLSKGLF